MGSISPDVLAIAAGDLDHDGSIDLATGSTTTTNELLVWENGGSPFSGTWSSGTGAAVGSTSGQVNAIALGDLDHDGQPDLVAGDSSNAVTMWQNDGTPFDGAWSTNGTLGTGVGAIRAIALADVDGDGNLDVVSASLTDNSGGYELIVWENPYSSSDTNPFDQTWTAHNVVSTGDLHAVAVADLNQDGTADIAAGDTSNQVRVWSNDGSWSFTLQATLTADGDVEALVATDLNRDGAPDLVSGGSVEGSGTHELIVWQNNTGWSFTGHDTGDTADTINALVTADLNLDSHADVVGVTDTGEDNEVIVWENDADAPFDWSFTQVDVGAATQNVEAATVADFDEDGDLDLAIGRATDGSTGYEVALWENVLVHRNMPFNGQGTGVGTSTANVNSVATGDLDGDGDPDLLSGGGNGEDYELIVWQNDGTPFIGSWASNDAGATPGTTLAVALGDLDNDGYLDAVAGSEAATGSELFVLENDGTPFSGLWTSNALADTDTIHDVELGDLDNDGYLDVVSGGKQRDAGVVVYHNDGTPFSGSWDSLSIGGSDTDTVRGVAIGDLDNDGYLDIVATSIQGYDTTIIAWQNDGTPFSGTWTSSTIAFTNVVIVPVLGDIDGDGDLDLATGAMLGDVPGVYVWENDGTPFDGTWTNNNVTSLNIGNDVDLADLDWDGDLDIIAAGSNDVTIWENDGSPFSGAWTQDGRVVTGVYNTAIDDLDHDGDLDIVSGGPSSSAYEVVAWQNAGGGALLDATDRSPVSRIENSTEAELVEVTFGHNGISGDPSLELNTFYLTFAQEDCSTAITSAQLNAIVDRLRVRLDDGDDNFDLTDTLVADVDTLVLDGNGVQTVAFTDGDTNAQVSFGGSATYWISVLMTSDADQQTPNTFCMSFDADENAVVDAKTPDAAVSIQDDNIVHTRNEPTVITLLGLEASSVGSTLPALLALLGIAAGLVVTWGIRRRTRAV